MRVQHQSAVVQMQVIVGNAAIPVGASRRTGNCGNCFERKGDAAACLNCLQEVLLGEAELASGKIINSKRPTVKLMCAKRRKDCTLKPNTHPATVQCITEVGHGITKGRE